ncbi:hypothetical protein SANTM175S_00636 [Streptomyces antimycoticus]
MSSVLPTSGPPTGLSSGTRQTTLRPRGGATAGVGVLGTERAEPGATETFTDDPALSEADWSAAIDTSTPGKAGFTTGPLKKDLRLSGSGTVTVTATPSTASAHLSAVLVDLGPATIRNYTGSGEGITTLDRRSCWGSSTADATPASRRPPRTGPTSTTRSSAGSG